MTGFGIYLKGGSVDRLHAGDNGKEKKGLRATPNSLAGHLVEQFYQY